MPRHASDSPTTSADGPTDRFERAALTRGARIVAGVDEAGRGPLAGPVIAAAVVLPATVTLPEGLNDSKQLKLEDRERIAAELMDTASVGIAVASRARIDRMNILRASLWAMARAVRALAEPPDHVLIDGRDVPEGLPCGGEAVIGGDGLSVSIAAASVVAKVTRDRLMTRLGGSFPAYGFEHHKGYSTRAHFDALRDHGPCPHHRQSFTPVREQQLGLDL